MKYIFLIATLLYFGTDCFAQQNKFQGLWSNTRYQRINGYVDKLSITRNPRYIKIDAEGHCTIMNDADHMIDLGLPATRKKNGYEEELTYKGKLTYVITTNESTNEFISLEISNSGFHVLLTRVKD